MDEPRRAGFSVKALTANAFLHGHLLEEQGSRLMAELIFWS
jgi:hypothetical protein